MVRSQVTRAIATLEKEKLVRVVDRSYKNFTVELRALDGSDEPYAMPGSRTKIIEIPGTLFLKMWHVTLTPTQLGCLLTGYAAE